MAELRTVTHTHQQQLSSAGTPLPDSLVDLDDIKLDDSDSGAEQDKKILFVKSADVRRRLEERLELKLLREELGIDDFDL